MIKSTIKAQYGEPRTGIKQAFIQIEIVEAIMKQNNVRYNIEHFAIINEETGAKTLIANSSKELSIAEFNQFSGAVTSLIQDYDTSEMNDFEIEQLRLKIGLLIYVKSDFLKDENGNSTGKVVWGLLPENYVIM